MSAPDGGTAPDVVVLDYGSGNTHSAVRALERAGARVTLTADHEAVARADGLVVPGVGAFAAVMEQLLAVGGDRMIDRRLSGARPVLGICVGLQVMFDRGVEHGEETEGLGQWPGVVEPLPAEIVPHMGWSTVRPPQDSALFAGVADQRFYFVHSYGVLSDPSQVLGGGDTPFVPPRVTFADHGAPFVAAVENGPLTATQFHPEKSGDAGARLLRNWVDSL